MFSVLFEVNPKPDRWDEYLASAKMLRPELEAVDGFIDNVRYKSLTRDGWILSLSTWRDEKALVRWRTRARHHVVQIKGRTEILLDYHLRVGQITHDSHPPTEHGVKEQRLDETEVGEGTAIVLISASRDPDSLNSVGSDASAAWFGLKANTAGLASWDTYDAVLTPGDVVLLSVWKNEEAARAFERNVQLPRGGRLRRVRVIRDYGMFDRREAPQYYPNVPE
ncbi:antibiotic biosynthesis monooxygenase [Bordetella genomosp. 8]|uniref:Antibiotic biosynthesis monooxygenase n=1 Tax=Bordetella genomosp. 8 TaxID=1416806 RepID=A0A1W6YPB7_9BORD|nr:antibiotic biosynthesis monooxygenase [Bordetella genomosp. 8]ARP82956.1 antibiotic biosynthesis monooxygenase [Bordetella genomosp. 8]